MRANQKVTADTNILASAYAFPSALTQRFIAMAAENVFTMCLSEEILEEFSRVIEFKLKFSATDCSRFISHIRSFTSIVKPTVKICIVRNDPTDNKIIEAASAGSSIIVSGDNHLLSFKKYKKIEIIQLSDFIRASYS